MSRSLSESILKFFNYQNAFFYKTEDEHVFTYTSLSGCMCSHFYGFICFFCFFVLDAVVGGYSVVAVYSLASM